MLHSSEVEELQLSIQLGTLRKDVLTNKRLMENAMLFIEQYLGDGEFSIARLDELRDEVDEAKEEAENADEHNRELEREVAHLERKVEQLEQEKASLDEENGTLEKEVAELRKAEAA